MLLILMISYFFNTELDQINTLWVVLWLIPTTFFADLLLRPSYTIKNDKLFIKSGLIKYPEINIGAIRTIKETTSLISSPAPSFDRLVIDYGKYDDIIVSPQYKTEFIEDLQKVNSAIQYKV